MNKENRSAAGLCQAAMAERNRIREEWAALKETDILQTLPLRRPCHKVVRNKDNNTLSTKTNMSGVTETRLGEVLRGVVALVEVGGERRARSLRATLAAIGASVVVRWSPLVTHLVWADGGCRATRARARALAARLVSPLWVEASVASARRLPEAAFPAAARPSDLPSPRTLRALLKRADAEGVPLTALFPPATRPRRSRHADADTSTDATTDTSTGRPPPSCSVPVPLIPSPDPDPPRVTKAVASIEKLPIRDKRKTSVLPVLLEDSNQMEIAITPHEAMRGESVSFVNTQPRRRAVVALAPPAAAAPRSRRKLFPLHGNVSSDEPSEVECEKGGGVARSAARDGEPLRADRALARAERMARRLVRTITASDSCPNAPRIVLSGMSRSERERVVAMVRALGGRVQMRVTRKTTHVLLGSCTAQPSQQTADLHQPRNMTGVSTLSPTHPNGDGGTSTVVTNDDGDASPCSGGNVVKLRTANVLEGAARGVRVLHARWAYRSHAAGRWLHHQPYEVAHLAKISQKARVERNALGLMRSEYAYDVFSGMRVRVVETVEHGAPARRLLTLCGAVLDDQAPDVTIGADAGQLAPKWVFDSVAAGRMRTTRLYLNH